MKTRLAVALAAAALLGAPAFAQELTPPGIGKPPILPLSEVKPGMQAIAWTVFSGMTPEPVPVEVIGIWRSARGPRQDIILCKMGGKAARTGVAGGMSGSPVYVKDRLMGAVSLRIGQFSPDAICGITPIEAMLEIQDFDVSRPPSALTPDKAQRASLETIPGGLPFSANAGGLSLVPIETPLAFSGFTTESLNAYSPVFAQMGITPVQGGSVAGQLTAKPVNGWQSSLKPGEAISGVLVSGDMSVVGMGTVTYNDGKRVLAFGHPLFELGPVEMPIAKTDILTVLASSSTPNKIGHATDVVGALRQDRHTGIMGEMGAEAAVIPVHVKVRAHADNNSVIQERDLDFQIFEHQKWTPFLMQMTLTNSLQQMNLYADEMTYRISADVVTQGAGSLHISNMFSSSDIPSPMPVILGGWWGNKFNRLFASSVTMPKLKAVNAVIDLLPMRRVADIETVWTPNTEVEAGSEIPVKIFLRPYRGGSVEHSLTVKIPPGLPKGEHRLLFSDADTLDRIQLNATQNNRNMDTASTVNLLNQERDNNRLYVSLVQNRPTFFTDDKTLPNLPASIQSAMLSARTTGRTLVGTPDTTQVQQSADFDFVVSGNYSLRIQVK